MEKSDIELLREKIDATAQRAQLVSAETGNKLFYAKAWAGKLLGSLGGESPYKNDGKRTTKADIEKTDARVVLTPFPAELTRVSKIDTLRQEITEITNWFEQFDGFSLNRKGSIARTQVGIYLTEARFELGFDLERIYNS